LRNIKKVRYLSVEEVKRIHEKITDLFFSHHPPIANHSILSQGMLESATSRPSYQFEGKDLYPDIYQKAAALLRSLVCNHPFLDGNKRTAVVCTFSFLFLNNLLMNPTAQPPKPSSVVETDYILEYVLKIARGQIKGDEREIIQNIAQWLKDNSVPLKLVP